MSSEQCPNGYKENLHKSQDFKSSDFINIYEVNELVLTLSLENMVFGCSSCVRDRHVRLARAVRHISLRSWTQKDKSGLESSADPYR